MARRDRIQIPGEDPMSRYPEVRAGDIMTTAVVCARPEQRLKELERALIENRVGGMPVVEGDRLVGVISRSDLTRIEVLMRSLDGLVSDELRRDEVQADGFAHAEADEFQGFRQRLDDLTVKDAMRDQVVTCHAATRISEVADAMLREHIHRVIVVEGSRPVGIVSSLDIVKLVAQCDRGQVS
jgi:CBS domain-containing protein